MMTPSNVLRATFLPSAAFLRRIHNHHIIISETIKILHSSTSEELEETNYTSLDNLLIPYTDSRFHLQLIRQVSSSNDALKFLKYLQRDATPAVLSYAFQIVLEQANRELNSHQNFYSLYQISKEWNIPLTVNSVVILLNHFSRSGLLEESITLFNEFERKNAHVCNVVIGLLLQNGRIESALEVFDEMPHKLGKEGSCVNNVSRSLFLRFVLGKERIEDLKEKVGFLLRFGEREIFPSSYQLTEVITRLCSGGESNVGWDLLCGIVELGGSVERPPWNALLTGFGKDKNFERMSELMAKMKATGVHPDVITFGIVIKNMCECGRVDEAMELFNRMSDGEQNDGVLIEPDVAIHNALIDGFCKAGRRPEGLRLLERMRTREGCRPNTVTYNCLIDGFCKAGETEKGRELFKQMKEDRVLPDIVTVNTLLVGMCSRGQINCAAQFFGEVRADGIKFDAVSSYILINAFCNVNK